MIEAMRSRHREPPGMLLVEVVAFFAPTQPADGGLGGAPTKNWLECFASIVGTTWTIVSDVLLFLLVVVAAWAIVRDVRRRRVLVDPIEIPKSRAEGGFTPNAIAQRVAGAIMAIERREPTSQTNEERFELTTSQIDFSVPTAGITYRNLIRYLRQAAGRPEELVRGELQESDTTLRLTLRTRDGRSVSEKIEKTNSDDDHLGTLISQAALAVYALIEPGLAVYNWFNTEQRDKKFDRTFAAAKSCLESAPAEHHHVAYTARANALTVLKRIDEAKGDYAAALALSPKYAPAHNGRGVLFRSFSHLDAAKDSYQRALKYDSRSAIALSNLGYVFNACHSYDQALRRFDRAIQLSPRYASAFNGRGYAKLKLGRLDDAERDLRRANDLDPKLVWPYVNRARVHRARGQTAEALAVLDVAMSASAALSAIHICRAEILADDMHLDDAEQEYRTACSLDAADGDALSGLARVHHLRGQHADAEVFFQKAIGADPDNPSAWRRWGALCQDSGRPDDAIYRYRRAIGLNRHVAFGHAAIAGVRLAEGASAEALEQARRAVAIDGTDRWAHVVLGRVLVAQTDRAHAFEAFSKALTRESRNAQVRRDLGALMLNMGQIEEGLAQIERARDLGPPDGWAALQLVGALFDLGRLKAAKREIDRTTAIEARTPELSMRRGRAFLRAERWEAAAIEFRRALAARPWSAQSNLGLARALAGQGDQKQAVDHVHRAAGAEPWNGECYVVEANILSNAGDYDGAAAVLAHACGQLSTDADLLTRWAVAVRYQARRAPDASTTASLQAQSEELLARAIEANPYASWPKRERAELEHDRAAAAATQPYRRGLLLRATIDILNDALIDDDRDWRAWSRLGDVRREVNDHSRAAVAYRSALDVWPRRGPEWGKLMEIFVTLDRTRDAEELIRLARVKVPAEEGLPDGLLDAGVAELPT